jgi:type II secretory pathway pseudopilin PulG
MRIHFNNGPATGVTKRAYTFVEVMVAVVLVLLMAVALYLGFSGGYAIVSLSRENLRATQILVRQMENVRLYTWEQITNTIYLPTSFVTSYDPSAAGGNTGTVYGVKIDITKNIPSSSGLPDGYRANMYLVSTTVSWTNISRGTNIIVRWRNMQTYVSKYGLYNYTGL